MKRLLPGACTVLLLSVLPAPAPAQRPAAGPYGLPPLTRADFNRLAARSGIPLHWTVDDAAPGTPDPAEVAVLGVPADRTAWVKGATFTPRFERAWRQLVEMRRLEAVRLELDRGFPTRVATDLSGLPAAEKDLVRRLLAAGERVDRLYRTQVGATALEPRIARADPESRALFERNHGPWCVAPGTEKDPFCNALPDFPARRWDAYPADEVHETALCERLAAHPDRAALMAPFSVVRRQGDRLAAVPLTQAYGRDMIAIARDLDAAAKAAGAAGGEEALSRYLLAAARGFRTNDWADADEAWAAMNSTNSRWYLRVGPDEVGWDLCNEKAGFHLALARIDRSAIDLQGRLSALRDEMERSLAALIGSPYAARPVSFHMPDFIEVVYNAGDSRPALGGVLGQSLPNWGRVATEGRGRTVVMTNLYQDPDSRSVARRKAALLLTPATLAHWSEDPAIGRIDVILHEAAHNLGPHSDYKVGGKGPAEAFGGRMAATLEELKAQTAAWFLADLLRRNGLIDEAQQKQIYVHALVWSFGHLSQGLVSATGAPKPYSQLSAVQVGRLIEAGALTWAVSLDPATGRPVGHFDMDFAKVHPAMEALMRDVGRVKATGDAAAAKELVEPYVSGDKRGLVRLDEIVERLRPFPRATMRYEVTL